MRFDAALFDLDGTLLNTLTDLSEAGNHALSQLGRPIHTRDAYRTLVGQGVRNLFIDALGPDHQDLLEDAIQGFHTYYAKHRFDTTAPYAGVDMMLSELVAAGVNLGVLSNKPHAATVDVVDRYFNQIAWSQVRGHQPGTAPKPDPTSAREVIAEMGTTAEQCIYIGDSKADMLTGKAAGMYTVGVSWGFRSVEELQANGADTIINTPSELLNLIHS